MSYGLEVYDKEGNVIIGSSYMTNRLWHYEKCTSTGEYSYDEPLDYRPILMSFGGEGAIAFVCKHIEESGEYTGFELSNPDDVAEDNALTIVIAIAYK